MWVAEICQAKMRGQVLIGGGGGRILYIEGCGSHLERFRKIFVRSGMKVSFCKNLTEEFLF